MSFQPKFKWVNSLEECADMINRPHEDYPDRVNVTLSTIGLLIEYQTDLISSFMARQIHSLIFPGVDFSGKWRECNVRVGDDFPIDFNLVKDRIETIFPVVRLRDLEPRKTNHLINWYEDFQIIHPFQDGNGRVGGCIVAVLSWDGEKLLAPLQ